MNFTRKINLKIAYRARIGISAALANLARSDDDRKSAVTFIRDVLDSVPENREAQIQLGLILSTFKKYNEALPLLQKSWSWHKNEFIGREYAKTLYEIGPILIL